MEESFYRDEEISREPRTLPAATYNLAHTLLAHALDGHRGEGCLFVPIRSMQYMAVIDHEEIIFVDREGARMIELAWQRFNPHARNALDEPVPYELVYYADKGRETMKRLPREFYLALNQLAQRRSFGGPAKVLKLRRNG
jgi:hypothetical protein